MRKWLAAPATNEKLVSPNSASLLTPPHMSDDSNRLEEPVKKVLQEEDGNKEEEENEWLRSTPKPKPKLFAYNWGQGTE